MLSKILKSRKRLDAADPAVRLAAIEALDAEQAAAAQAALGECARTDTDPRVRRAAIERLDDDALLGELLSDTTVAGFAAERIAARIALGRPTAHRAQPLVQRALARQATDLAELENLEDPARLIDTLLHAAKPLRDRLLEDARLRDANLLQELERRSRDNKAVNRFARNRLEEIRGLRNRYQQLFARGTELAAALEKTLAREEAGQAQKLRALYAEADQTVDELTAAARALGDHGEAAIGFAEVTGNLARLRAAHVTPPPVETAPPPRPTRGEAADSADPFARLADAFVLLESNLQRDTDWAQQSATRQRLTEAWLAEADHRPPTAEQHRVFERVSHAFHELADAHARLDAARLPDLASIQLPVAIPKDAEAATALWESARRCRAALQQTHRALARIEWPSWAPPAASVRAAQDRAGELEHALERLDSLAEAAAAEADALLTELEGHIEQGELRASQNAMHRLRNLLRTLPPRLADRLGKRTAHDSALLGELRDWQTFATGPKRQALCAAMAELAARPLAAAEQAERIKDLRREWKALGPIANAAEREQLEAFNRDAERAFEPCRAHFAEQASTRAKNQAARQQICEQLEQYLESTDWAHADYKAAERILRTARDEWHAFHPVDRKAGGRLQSRFEALQDRLHEKIKAEWDRNLERKRAIVAEAEALLSSELGFHERTEAAKQLQRRWRDVGPTPRRPDQQLWKALRAACDRIFEAREDARQAAQAAVVADERTATQLLDELEAELHALDTGKAPDQRTLAEFHDRFNALPSLPERVQRGFRRRFDDLVRSYRHALTDAASAERRRRVRWLLTQDAALAALEVARAAGEPVIFELDEKPFAARWTQSDAVPLETLKRMTIEAEIAADLDSPADDRALRLSIQVELMNSGLGRRALTTDALALAERWCALGPKLDDAAPLRDRFAAALEALERH